MRRDEILAKMDTGAGPGVGGDSPLLVSVCIVQGDGVTLGFRDEHIREAVEDKLKAAGVDVPDKTYSREADMDSAFLLVNAPNKAALFKALCDIQLDEGELIPDFQKKEVARDLKLPGQALIANPPPTSSDKTRG